MTEFQNFDSINFSTGVLLCWNYLIALDLNLSLILQ